MAVKKSHIHSTGYITSPSIYSTHAVSLALLMLVLLEHLVKSLAPEVYTGDSGELSAAAFLLAVPHPTGFPVLLMLGRLFIFLPLGNIAYATNLASAIAGCGAAIILALILIRLKFSLLVAVSSPLVLILGRTTWSQSAIYRVYTLSILFIALLVLLAINYRQDPRLSYLYSFSFISALAMGSHFHALLGILGGLIILGTSIGPSLRTTRLRDIIISIFFFILGLSVYLYIPIRASRKLIMNWLFPFTWDRFLSYMSQKEYAFKMMDRSLGDILEVLKRVLAYNIDEFGVVFFIVGITGGLIAILRLKIIGIAVVIIALGNVVIMLLYGNRADMGYVYRYLLPFYFCMAFFIGCFIESILSWLKKIAPRLKVIFYFLLSLSLAMLIIRNYYYGDKSRAWLAYDFGKHVINTAAQEALIFLEGDNITFIPFYLKSCQNWRQDLVFMEAQGYFYPNTRRGLPRMNWSGLMRFISDHTTTPTFMSVVGEFFEDEQIMPQGFLFRVRKGISVYENLVYFPDYIPLRGLMDASLYKDFTMRAIVGHYLIQRAEIMRKTGLWEQAKNTYLQAARYAVDMPDQYNNIGNALAEMGYYAEAERMIKESIRYRPRAGSGYSNLGIIYNRWGRNQLAIETFNQGISLDADNWLLYYNLAMVYKDMGDMKSANKAMQKALNLNPALLSRK